MFTGMIQNLGTVLKKEKQGGQIRFEFQLSRKEKKPLEAGESIAVDGVCLTVSGLGMIRRSGLTFSADVIGETLEATTLGALYPGDRVNLERPLKAGDWVGGHFVTGHVDGKGILKRIDKKGRNIRLTFQAPENVLPFLAAKGSVAVDGISLTIQAVRGKTFQAGVVPHTLRAATLGFKKPGDKVNLEADLIARYLRMIPKNPKIASQLSRPLKIHDLKRQGF